MARREGGSLFIIHYLYHVFSNCMFFHLHPLAARNKRTSFLSFLFPFRGLGLTSGNCLLQSSACAAIMI